MKISLFTRGFGYGAVVTASVNYTLWYLLSGDNLDGQKQKSVAEPSFTKRIPDTDKVHEDTDQLALARKALKYGTPQHGSFSRVYEGHVLSYDQMRKIPRWTAEYLTKNNLEGMANRKHSQFKPDPHVDVTFTALNDDYRRSGWSRGHMVPAGDLKHSQKAMDETFYLTNVVPQDLDNNSGFWNRFEIFCRDLTSKFDEVRIITGPLFIPGPADGNGRRWMKHQVIGDNDVHVPTHLYKIIVAENIGQPQSVAVAAFAVPNEKISSDRRLTDFRTTVSDLEGRLGMRLLPDLPATRMTDLCTEKSCRLMSQSELDRHFLSKKLGYADTLDDLENVWAEVKRRRVRDEKIADLYERRKRELSDSEANERKRIEL